MKEFCKYKEILSENIFIILMFEKWVILNWLIEIWQYLDLIIVIQVIDDKDLNFGNDSKNREREFGNYFLERISRIQ